MKRRVRGIVIASSLALALMAAGAASAQKSGVARNPDYWKAGRPYLDGIEYTIIKEMSTRNLGFVAGKFDLTSPYGGTSRDCRGYAGWNSVPCRGMGVIFML
jgi:ABC-type transport system substrate-binding protein